MSIKRAAAIAVAGVLVLPVSGCSSDDEATTPDVTSESSSPTPTGNASDDGGGTPAGDKIFTLRTADGQIILDGSASDCDDAEESTVKVTFTSSDGTTVDVDATDGKGSVLVSGATEFEGKITAVSVGDSGDVAISGSGSPADDSSEPTSFTITGSCA